VTTIDLVTPGISGMRGTPPVAMITVFGSSFRIDSAVTSSPSFNVTPKFLSSLE